MRKRLELEGKRFGRLTVLERAEPRVTPKGYINFYWKCVCDCGTVKEIAQCSLTNHTTKSCGCLRGETHFNDYYITDGVAYVKCIKGEFVIDAEDVEKISHKRWQINRVGYVMSNDKLLVHRIITDCPKGLVVDHINHDPLDNRKNNLRICTQRQNLINKKSSSNTGEFGISRTKHGFYMIQIGGKYRGSATNLERAIEIRNEALKGSDQEKYNSYL